MLHLFISIILSSTILAQSSHNNHKPGPEITLKKSLSFPTFGPNNINQDITLLGSAAIPPQAGCIQIPDPENPHSSAGRAIYASPVRLFDPSSCLPASFETTFSFRIRGPTSGGLSFVIAPDELTTGRPGPWLGMLNDACEDDLKVVAVELDTRMNPEFGDPSDNHVGVNLGSIVSAASANASSAFGVRLNDGELHRASITYDGTNKSLSIFIGPGLSDEKARPENTVFFNNIDLSPYLNEYMFIGFSGSTGDDSHPQIHSVCSWNFSSATRARLRVPSPESCASKIMVGDDGNIPSKTPSSFYIFVAAVALVLMIMISLFFNRKKGESYEFSDEMAVVGKEKKRPVPPNRARKFSLAEIHSATRRFGESQVLGSDRNSVTYKGSLLNGSNVVVKRFSREVVIPVRRRMMEEVKTIGKIRHPNIVPVRGWCFDNQETIVLYEFIGNGSLDKWLFGFGVVPWTRRFKVVKASSVFIDVSFRAVLGDFGFVLSLGEASARFEAMVSQKVDIFEFGVLMMEAVSGRGRETGLLDLAWALHESGEKAKLVDRSVNPDQAVRVMDVGLMCTLNENRGRPSMEEVVGYLNSETPLPDLPTTRPVSLFPYSSTTGLCSAYSCASFK
ncbi:probable L-type lectin-domain containing receptor kinase S.7 [Salvia hispanica]|uniref:probable L-type lectin-domain containing receptor kinase S.7 n=1 Tax=Salvia hispanica TaxID=49212 RepID=UPI002009AE52|nr:probable L-type lectin-domain containing receptor kinase S.7 [Salvia hispanica]